MENTNIPRKVKRGEIYLYDFGANPESIQNGVRPVLVVQCDEGNEASKTTIIAAMTTVIKKCYMSSHIVLGDNFGLKEPSMVMLEQIRTVNQFELTKFIGFVDSEYLQKRINIGLKKILGFWVERPPKRKNDIRCLCCKCLNDYKAKFVEFTAQSYQYKHWLPLFTVLLGTGGRIGEILGLRWEDCDFPNSIININHTLIYRKYTDEASHFAITTPKTKSGVRIIPMLSDVKAALTEEYKEQLESGFNESVVDGYSGFIFKSRDNTVLSPHCVNRAIDRIIKACNAKEEEDAKEERREPELLPHFSCHHLRHTFCTRFCENETNLKIIQEIMGHADITTTMDIYNEATKDKKMESFAGLEGKIKIR